MPALEPARPEPVRHGAIRGPKPRAWVGMGLRASVRRCLANRQRVAGWLLFVVAVLMADASLKKAAQLDRDAQLAAHLRNEQAVLQTQVEQGGGATGLAERSHGGAQPTVPATLARPETAAAEQPPATLAEQVSCTDSSEHCVSWTADSQCVANAAYMQVICALSCKPGCAAQRPVPQAPPAPPPPPALPPPPPPP